MRNIVRLLATISALAVAGTGTPAFAAMGQCYDGYGHPFGPPHDTDNSPYDLICRACSVGGSCTHVQPGWAESNYGIGPRYPAYKVSPYTYGPGFRERPRRYDPRYPCDYIQRPDPTHPPFTLGPPNQAR